MLNPSKIISNIKMDLGIIGIHLPYDNVDELIMEIIQVKTLPIFNEIQPNKVPLNIDLNKLPVVEVKNESKIYELPDVFGDREIMMVTDIEPTYDEYRMSGHNSHMFAYGGNMCLYGYQDMILAQASSNAASAFSKGTTFNFIAPNKIEIFSEYGLGNNYRLEVAIEHADNLSTIAKTCFSSFVQLATLDVKKYMYDNLKHYNDLQTAYGQLSLKIEDWSNCDDERKQLIEKWSQSYHLDLNQYIIV